MAEEWILVKKENIRQDLQDYIDKRAFGPTVTRRRRRKSHSSCKSCLKKELKIESIQHSLPLWEIMLRRICYRNYE